MQRSCSCCAAVRRRPELKRKPLDEEDLPHPRWLATATRLDDLWFVDDFSINGQATIDATPPALRRRGVIINAEELVSV